MRALILILLFFLMFSSNAFADNGASTVSSADKGSETSLKKALSINPEDPQTNLELGILYYNRGIYDEARDFFETVKTIAPGTKLSEQAEEYIREIEKKEKAGIKGKRWGLNLTGGFQYDSNVVLEPSDGTLPEGISRKSDWRGIIYFEGKYTPILTEKLTLGPTYSFYQSLHTKLHDFNVQQHQPGLSLNYIINKDFSLRANYAYEYTTVGGEGYLSSHTLSPIITIAEGKGFFVSVRYRYQRKDFRDSDLFMSNSERNGSNNLIGITQYIPLGSVASLKLGYAHDVDSADRKYWSYRGDEADIDLNFDLGKKWALDLSGQYYRKDYREDYPGTTTRRDDKTTTYSINLTKTFDSKYDITAGWLHIRNESNINVFEYKRDILTFIMRVGL